MTAAKGAMRGPAIFLAQFMGDAAPFDNLDNAARWRAIRAFRCPATIRAAWTSSWRRKARIIATI